MWALPTIRIVPRPSASGMAPFLVLLGTYAWFVQNGAQIAGRQCDPLILAMGMMVLTHILRATLVARRLKKSGPEAVFSALFRLLFLIGTGVLVLIGDPAKVQAGFTAFLLLHAALLMAVLRFFPEDVQRLPSVWASSDPLSGRAIEILAFSLVMRALAAQFLAFYGAQAVWVAFVSIGSVLLHFLTNWVIVLMFLAEEADEG